MTIRKKKMSQQRMSGQFRPETWNEETRTLEVVFTTGQSGKRYDWWNDVEYLEELDVTPESVRTERLDKGLSVIDNHRTYNGVDGVFGITEEYRFEDGKLIGNVRFATDEKSDERAQKVRDGILRHVSLGYKVHKYLKSRGEQDKIDTYRAVDWEPTELSFVPVSFETNNGVRAEQRENEPTFEVEIIEENQMNEQQLKRLALLQGMTTRSAEQETELQNLLALQARSGAPEVVSDPTPAPVATPAVRTAESAPVAAPAVDVSQVASQTRGELRPMIEAAEKAGIETDFAVREFENGTDLNQFRGLLIDKLGEKSNDQRVNTVMKSDERKDEREMTRQGAEQILLQRSGKIIEDPVDAMRDFTGLSLIEVARKFVEASGISTRGMSTQRVAERAFHSTSDLPLILENVMNKNLQDAYAEVPQTWRDLGRRTTVNDFREKHTYKLGDAPNLLPLGEHGEYKAGTFSEGKEKYSIATYARKIGFTRQMLINDDMSALDRMPMLFGRAGNTLESDIVWGLILNYDFINNKPATITMGDGKALFHADHGNLQAGGAGAGSSLIDENGLSNLRKMGRKQKTLDGNFLNIMFDNIVVPEDLETTAEKMLLQTILPATTADTNPFLNKLQHRVEPRLSVVSTKAWYAFSRMVDTFEYAYLAGEEEMYTEAVTQTDIDGMEIKVRKDFGAGLIDWRGMAKMKGEA